MSEYLHVEKPFLDQLRRLEWKVIDQGCGAIPSDPTASLRASFRQVILPEDFREAVRSINLTDDGEPWLAGRQLDDLRDQIFRQSILSLLEANEVANRLLLKAWVAAGHFRTSVAVDSNRVDATRGPWMEVFS
jgi:type I restriction enzyme R subunit